MKVAVPLSLSLLAAAGCSIVADHPDGAWLGTFEPAKCTRATTGKNRFFILEPGYQLILAEKNEQVAVSVLEATEKVDGIETRVIEEREWDKGKLKEVSRNYFTICKEHGDLFTQGLFGSRSHAEEDPGPGRLQDPAASLHGRHPRGEKGNTRQRRRADEQTGLRSCLNPAPPHPPERAPTV